MKKLNRNFTRWRRRHNLKLPDLSQAKIHRIMMFGILVFALLLGFQILYGGSQEQDTALAGEAERPTPAILGMFHTFQREQVVMPIPSGNPTPLPTFTPTPTPTSTPTPTPTNTPTPSLTPLPTNTPTPTPVKPPPPAPAEIDEMFRRYSSEYGVEEEKLRRIAACESGYNASSHNTRYDYAGMFQFSHATWISTRTEMSADPNPDLRFNAEESIRTAAFKISRGGERAWRNCL